MTNRPERRLTRDAPQSPATHGHDLLVIQGNLASTYRSLGRLAESLSIRQKVYAQRLRLSGEEHDETIREAICYALNLIASIRFEEAKALLRRTTPVARRVLGDSHEHTLQMRANYAKVIIETAATLDDFREAVTTLEETERIARRVLGGAHPLTTAMEDNLRQARAALRAREEAVAAIIYAAAAALAVAAVLVLRKKLT